MFSRSLVPGDDPAILCAGNMGSRGVDKQMDVRQGQEGRLGMGSAPDLGLQSDLECLHPLPIPEQSMNLEPDSQE